MPRARALVVLNPTAHGGRAVRRFRFVREAITSTFDATIVEGWPINEIHRALDRGVRIFIAAGGDGTAHTLLNAIVAAPDRPPLDSLVVGAVGLGSSNDLLKPVRHRIHGIPVRFDAERAVPRDLVRCSYRNVTGSHRALLLVSASLGLAAYANSRFQESTVTARILRRVSTGAAIAVAATRSLLAWRNLSAGLRIDSGDQEHISLSNLSILKTEWLSGRLRFGHPVEPDSGDFDVALAEGLGRCRLAADVLALLRGRFDQRHGHRRMRARSLEVRLDAAAPLELDGEIVEAAEAHFDMFPERIRLCA